jgi:hypothetical protein
MPEPTASEAQPVALMVTDAELELIRTALRLLRSALGREEAEELAEVQALLQKLGAPG